MVNVRPRPLYPRERAPARITQEGGWAPRAGLKGNGEEEIPKFKRRIVQLYRLSSPGPRTHCVAYTTHRYVRKAERYTAQLVSPKCVLAHASRFQRSSDSPSTDRRAFAFPSDVTHTVDARFATELFVRLCCP